MANKTAPKKVGRKPSDKNEKIYARFTPEEKRDLEERALKEERTLSGYVRFLCLRP